MVTPKQIAEKTMTPEKKGEDKNDLFGSRVGRPISYVLTVPFLAAGIKANTVSFFSILVSIAGFLLLGFSTSQSVQIVGAILFILWGVLDCVDGNIARYTGQSSPLGVLWDAAAGYPAMALMYFSTGLSVMNEPQGLFPLIIPDYWYIALGGIVSLSTLYVRLVMHKKMLLFSKSEAINLTDKASYSLPKIVALNLTAPSGFVTILILLSVIFNCAREFTVFYFLIHVVITVVTMRNLMRK